MLYCRFHRVKIKFLIDFDWLNYRIYPQLRHKADFLTRDPRIVQSFKDKRYKACLLIE
jgi:hypothetical protein